MHYFKKLCKQLVICSRLSYMQYIFKWNNFYLEIKSSMQQCQNQLM